MSAEFVIAPGRDTEMMAKYGLGGIAVVGDLVFTGGMAIDLRTLKRPVEADTIAAETRLCFEGVERSLQLLGCTLRDVARITGYVEDPADRDEMRATVDELFAAGPGPKHVTLVGGIGGDCRVEFEVLAVRPQAPPGSGRLVFAAASAIDPATMRRVPEAATLHDEVRVCLERLERRLGERGLTLRDLAKVTCWVSDEAHRMEFISAYRDLLAPAPYPSRATFSAGLVGDCRVEIDAIAAGPAGGDTT